MGTNEEEDTKTELNEESKTAGANVEPENVAGNQPEEDTKGSNPESLGKKTKESDKRGAEAEMKKKEVSPPMEAVVDKELLQVLYQPSNLTSIFKFTFLLANFRSLKQAFRFFDRNLVGYIRVNLMVLWIFFFGCISILTQTHTRKGKEEKITVFHIKLTFRILCSYQVEDMRMVIHNMGKFLSHRDVKVRRKIKANLIVT